MTVNLGPGSKHHGALTPRIDWIFTMTVSVSSGLRTSVRSLARMTIHDIIGSGLCVLKILSHKRYHTLCFT